MSKPEKEEDRKIIKDLSGTGTSVADFVKDYEKQRLLAWQHEVTTSLRDLKRDQDDTRMMTFCMGMMCMFVGLGTFIALLVLESENPGIKPAR